MSKPEVRADKAQLIACMLRQHKDLLANLKRGLELPSNLIEVSESNQEPQLLTQIRRLAA